MRVRTWLRSRWQAAGIGSAPQAPDDDLERRFRGTQIAAVQKYTPIMMLGNIVNAILFVGVAYHAELLAFALPWMAVILFYSVMATRSWRYGRRRDPRKGASARAIRRAVVNAWMLGVVWAVAAIVIYPAAGDQGQTVVAVIVGGMIYGGGFALSAIPAAMNAYLAPLGLGGLCALALHQQPVDLILAIPFTVFSFIIQRAGVGHGRLLRLNFDDRERLSEQSNVIRLLLHDFERGTSDWLWQTDSRGRLQRGAERIAEATAVSVDLLRGGDFRELTNECCDDTGCHFALLQQHFTERTPFRGIEVRFSSTGGPRWLRLSGHPLIDQAGTFIGFRGVASDISTEKTAERRISYLARHDALTGLLNRSSFGDELDSFFAAYRATGEKGCLLYLDLDGFKDINDQRGHVSGDRLLVDIADRIAEVTATEGVVARIGGDEFGVLLRGADHGPALDLAARLTRAVSEPLVLDGDLVRIGASIGIAFVGPDAESPESLVSAADIALYRAKADGRNTFRVFDSEMRSKASKRQELQHDLHFAVERNELELHYQPIVLAGSGATGGFEALLRWRHPVRGLLAPGEFIHLAESGGTIHDIGRWVMREACRAAATWPPHMIVSVNLSPQEFRSPDLPDRISEAMAASGLGPDRLEAELTESVQIEDAAAIAANILALKDLGVSVALDDFGTGYSSFGYLATFGFDRLKVDRSLVERCDEDERARDVLEAIMVMCRALGLRTTAEGVEKVGHAAVLKSLGCELLQGYLFARPLDPEGLREELAKWSPAGPPS